jgi:hypothetical protein
MDDESAGVLRRAAAQAEGLPLEFAHRLNGESYSELKIDARRARKDFGLAEEQTRDPSGRFASTSGHQDFNNALRAAAGFPAPADERPPGDVGVGRGGAALPRQPKTADMNDLIRAARGVQTSAVRDLAAVLASERAS